MLAYRTPGVYFEWLDTRERKIGTLRTDIAGFVGIAKRGPLHEPMTVESWTQFTSIFGAHIPQGYLAYAVEGFFANGGRTCWVVRTAHPQSARAAFLSLMDGARPPQPTLRLMASSPGVWGHQVSVSVTRSGVERFSLTLRVSRGGQELWRDLTIRRSDPRYVQDVLNHERSGSRLVIAQDLNSPSPFPLSTPDPSAANLRVGTGWLGDGKDGLSTLTPQHLTKGLGELEAIDEVSIVAIPDIMNKPQISLPFPTAPRVKCDMLEEGPSAVTPPASQEPLEFPRHFSVLEISVLQHELIAHCRKLKDRMALLDPPGSMTPADVLAWRSQFDTDFAAAYFPWLRVPDPLRLDGPLRAVPPSGHVAGVYARGDRELGVHKPPANEVVEAASDVLFTVDDIVHGDLNYGGVNAIRPYPGRGLRVAGARTLSSDRLWQFVNVRRLLFMIEEAIEESAQWTAFEPNNRDLWREVDRVVRGFLDNLWRRGMLDGATAAEAYDVTCDETTNPPSETELGRMICLIGVQPPWPAEFVIARIGITEDGVELLEVDQGSRG